MHKLNSSSSQEIDIGGQKVCVGSRVNVRWKGEWYDGQVIKLGPRRNLCRIRDLSSNQTLLLEAEQVKSTQTRAVDQRLESGNQIVYNDNERWLEGIVMTSTAVGVLQASWRRSVRGPEEQNWFEIVNVAPVQHDEVYLERNRDDLAASRSGLLPVNAVEPRPRTMENALFDPTEEDRDTDKLDGIASRHHSPGHNKNDTFPISPTYEDIEEELQRARRTKGRPLPNPPLDQINDPLAESWLCASPSFSPSHSVQPPPSHAMAYPHISPYALETWGLGQGTTTNHNPAHSFHIPHPRAAPDKNLEQSALPCALSYQLNHLNGIPPHRSSNFFKGMNRTIALPSRDMQMSESNIFSRTMLKQSPSILSRAVTEPLSNFGTLPVIPRREKKRNRLFSAKKKQQQKKLSTKVNKKPEPLPYEVPTKPQQVRATQDEESKYDLNVSVTEGVPRPQTSTPKKKPGAPVITSASPSLLSVNMGENILITCIASGKGSVTYEWYKDGDRLTRKASNIEELSPGKLEIQKAQPDDEGMYRCVAKNKHGSDNRYFKLNVTMQYRSPTKHRSPHREARRGKKAAKKQRPDLEEQTTPNVPLPEEDEVVEKFSKESKAPTAPQEENQVVETVITEPEVPIIPLEDDPAVKNFLSNLIEDIQIPDAEFSVGVPDDREDKDENKKASDVENDSQSISADEKNSLEHSSVEVGDKLEDIPEIVGIPPRKGKVPRRVSVGNKAAGDMDLYLGGYGEDYGSKSSTTDLEQEGLRFYKEREIKKSLAQREKGRQSSKESSPTKTTDEEEERHASSTTFKQKSKKLLKFSKFTRKKKTTQREDEEVLTYVHSHRNQPAHNSDDVTRHHNHSGGMGVNGHTHNHVTPPHYDDVIETKKVTGFTIPQVVVDSSHVNGDREEGNSITVNTSLGGTDSEDTVVDEAAAEKIKGHVHLPLESLPVSDRVRLLQQSVREHHPDDFAIVTSRKKGFFSGIFSKGKNIT